MKRLGFLGALLLLFGCEKQTLPPLQKPVVIVTLPPYETLVKQIASDAFEVRTLIPEGVDPHTFELSARDTQQFYGASAWFSTGDPQEKKYHITLKEHFPNLECVDLSTAITPLTYDQDTRFLERGDHHDQPGHAHDAIDYHIWMAPETLILQVHQIVKTLAKIDPTLKEHLEDQGDVLIDRLKELHQRFTTLLEPYKGDAILVTHPSYGYFTHAYGLEQISIEAEGKQVRLRDLVETFPTLKRASLRAVVAQPQTSTKPAELFASELELPLYTIDPNLADYEKTYQLLIDAIRHDS